MTRWRHRLLAAAAALPLLLVSLVATAGRPGAALWVVAAWALALLVLEGASWRALGVPLADLTGLVEASSSQQAYWTLRELRDDQSRCAAERDRMATLVESLSSSLGEGLVVLDAELRINLINQVARRFSGVDTVRRDAHLLEVMREPGVVEIFERAAAGERPRPVVLENPRGLWELRVFPVTGGGAVGLMSDISVIRRASEFRRRFVQDLSHELRSPLAVLRTTVEAMEDEVDPELAAMLVRQVERIDRLAAELNDLASIEAGQYKLNLELVPVLEAVGDVVADHHPEAARAAVRIDVGVPEGLECWCDRQGLYRVLSNLVDNAIKYNRSDGWVRIRGSATDDGVVIQVADSGEGIPAGELQAVLQRFYRIDRARTPGEGGLGLGLAIVKHMVHYMGGTLDLDSREEVGTTVTLTFPIRLPDRAG